jgi:general secretion pathway protein F
MTTFDYAGFDARGRRVGGLLEAQDAKDARARLAAQGIACESLAPATARTHRQSRSLRFPPAARAMAYRELAALLDSGVTLVPALDVLLQAPAPDSVRLALAAARDNIRDGLPLSQSVLRWPVRLAPYEVPILEAGESTGGMPQALSQLAAFLEESATLREKLLAALLYPAIVVVLATLLGGLVMTFLLPRMAGLLAETGMAVPMFTRVLFAAARILGPILLLVFAVAAVAVPIARRRARRDAQVAAAADERLYRMPGLGPAWRELASLRFVRTLSLLLRRGIGLLEALPLAAQASGSAFLLADARRETEALAQGKPLADVVRSIRALHPSLAAWVRAGQGGGDLVGLLDNAAVRLRQSWDQRASRSVALLEIALTLVVGILVALVALAILLPVLQMNKGIL